MTRNLTKLERTLLSSVPESTCRTLIDTEWIKKMVARKHDYQLSMIDIDATWLRLKTSGFLEERHDVCRRTAEGDQALDQQSLPEEQKV